MSTSTSDVRPAEGITDVSSRMQLSDGLLYIGLGTLFGIILIKSEGVAWFRIQEMFRFQAVHMSGILGSAVAVAAAGLVFLRRLNARTIHGAPLRLNDKPFTFGRGVNQRGEASPLASDGGCSAPGPTAT